jgi:hypothetical protein
MFCGSNCTGTGSVQQNGDVCVGAPAGYVFTWGARGMVLDTFVDGVDFDRCTVGSFFVISSDPAAGGQATTTTVAGTVTVLATSTISGGPSTQPQVTTVATSTISAGPAAQPQVTTVATSIISGGPSAQSQVNTKRQNGSKVWEIVAGVLLALTAVCFVILTAYWWRRRRNAKLKTDMMPLGKLALDSSYAPHTACSRVFR